MVYVFGTKKFKEIWESTISLKYSIHARYTCSFSVYLFIHWLFFSLFTNDKYLLEYGVWVEFMFELELRHDADFSLLSQMDSCIKGSSSQVFSSTSLEKVVEMFAIE